MENESRAGTRWQAMDTVWRRQGVDLRPGLCGEPCTTTPITWRVVGCRNQNRWWFAAQPTWKAIPRSLLGWWV